jgi:hypothetical protein
MVKKRREKEKEGKEKREMETAASPSILEKSPRGLV